jgi:hypothetical protein
MGQHQSSTVHEVRQHVKQHIFENNVVSSEALRREFAEYLKVQKGKKSDCWNRETTERFISDMRSLLGLVRIVHVGELSKELPNEISFEMFRSFFLETYGEQVDLSVSLRNESTPVIDTRNLLDVQLSTVMIPANPDLYIPPGMKQRSGLVLVLFLICSFLQV